MRRMTRVAGCLLALVATAVLSCHFLLPERLAVNAPLGPLLLGSPGPVPADAVWRERLQAAGGLSIEVFAEVPRARWLRFTSAGDLLVSLPREGRVDLVLRDRSGDGQSDGIRTVIDGLERPHGLDLHEGWLWIGETDAVGRVRFDAERGETRGRYERVITGLPAGGNHWSRTVRFGPDGGLYVSVGSSCNVCEEADPRRAALLRYEPDGSGEEIFASGLRNAVGFDWRPGSGELFATDNGRDLLGDDTPPCELNRIVRGGFYGWPFAFGERVPDPDLGAGRENAIDVSIPPAHEFRAHNAPLGIDFVEHDDAPRALRGAALVALHGSWNRTRKDGYKVVSLHFDPDGGIEERDFLWGFLEDDSVIGRPVDVAVGPDGAIYVSDDYAGRIYRVSTAPSVPRPAASAEAPPRDPWGGLTAVEREDAGTRGAALYAEHDCASCHEAERAAPGVATVPLRGLTARYDVRGLRALLDTPPSSMPAAPLDDAQRDDLAIHLLLAYP